MSNNTTMTADEVVAKVESCAAANHAARIAKGLNIKDCTAFAVGDAMRQGDVYLHRVADSHPRGKRLTNRQLAIGTTQGSRHMAEERFEVYEGTAFPPGVSSERAFLGPCIVLPPGESELVSHPEHAYSEHAGGTTWQITHQMDEAAKQRVRD